MRTLPIAIMPIPPTAILPTQPISTRRTLPSATRPIRRIAITRSNAEAKELAWTWPGLEHRQTVLVTFVFVSCGKRS